MSTIVSLVIGFVAGLVSAVVFPRLYGWALVVFKKMGDGNPPPK